jgi:hypothetical protein
MSQSLTVRIPDELWAEIEKYGLAFYPNGEGFDKTKTAIALFKAALNLNDSSYSSLDDVVRQEDLSNAIAGLQETFHGLLSDSSLDIVRQEDLSKAIAELQETFHGLLDRQSQNFATQISELKSNYQAEIDLLEVTSEENWRYAKSLEEEKEQGISAASLAPIFEDVPPQKSEGLSAASLAEAVEDVPRVDHKPTSSVAISKAEKKLIEKIKKELKAIGFTFQAWRQAQGVWLIWRDRDESYKSAKIRLYKFGGQREWKLVRLNSENSWVPVSENNQVNKAIAPLLVELRNLVTDNHEQPLPR